MNQAFSKGGQYKSGLAFEAVTFSVQAIPKQSSSAKSHHIFQSIQVTSSKMVHKKIFHFLAKFSISFHLVWSALKETPSDWSKFIDSQSDAPIQLFLKQTHHVKGYGQLFQKMVSFLHFVWGHMGVLQDVPYNFITFVYWAFLQVENWIKYWPKCNDHIF